MATESTPFIDLPAALVDEVLQQSSSAGDALLDAFRRVKTDRAAFRQALLDQDLVLHESSFGYPSLPTTCAADGSYAVERLLTADMVAAAAVAAEGLTPPSEKRYWEQPHHSTFVVAEAHHAETARVLQAIMVGRELLLATSAPHDLIMLDGTLAGGAIRFNEAVGQAADAPSLRCSQEFFAHFHDYLEAYRVILRAERSDRNYVGLSKYSTRREIGRKVGWPGDQDDRGLLTLLLQRGELTRPLPLEAPASEWRLYTHRLPEEIRNCIEPMAEEVVKALRRVHVFYYRPHAWLPALRVEAAGETTRNMHRLACIVLGLKHQCAVPSMLEPYPLYLADRTVRALARALPAFRQVTTQSISERYEGDIGEVFFAMHGYRSEIGG